VRLWFNGKMFDFQSEYVGSILTSRSFAPRFEEAGQGPRFFFCQKYKSTSQTFVEKGVLKEGSLTTKLEIKKINLIECLYIYAPNPFRT
jgi:hypothetical protein